MVATAPCRGGCSADLARFKRLTMGHCASSWAARRSSRSAGRCRDRRSIVLTRDGTGDAGFDEVGSSFPRNLDAAGIARCHNLHEFHDEAFVIGGGEIYRLALPHLADRVYLTRVHTSIEGDATFPELEPQTSGVLADSQRTIGRPTRETSFRYSFESLGSRLARGITQRFEGSKPRRRPLFIGRQSDRSQGLTSPIAFARQWRASRADRSRAPRRRTPVIPASASRQAAARATGKFGGEPDGDALARSLRVPVVA